MSCKEYLASGPGTGKTTYAIRLFRETLLRSKSGIDSRSFFVLPNREHADRIRHLVLQDQAIDGLFNTHILTINDLSDRLLGAMGREYPTDAIRRALLKEILTKSSDALSADLARTFKYFSAARDFEGFYTLILDNFAELGQGLISIEAFEKAAQPLLKDPAFREKFRAFTVLFKAYRRQLRALGLREPEETIQELLSGKRLLGDKLDLVIFDGFYHFTEAQKALLAILGRKAEKTLVTLTLGSGADRRPEVFDYTLSTKAFLARNHFVPVRGDFSANRRTTQKTFIHCERNLFYPETKPYDGEPEGFSLVAAEDPRTEIRVIAGTIQKQIGTGRYDFSDIAIILRQVGDYEKSIESIFGEYKIPYQLHERKKYIEHGFCQTLYRFLKLPSAGWQWEDLRYVLKSSYLEHLFAAEDVLWIERMALSQNITESKVAWTALADLGSTPGAVTAILRRLSEWERGLLESKDIHGFLQDLEALLRAWLGSKGVVVTDAIGAQDVRIFESLQELFADSRRFYASKKSGTFEPILFINELLHLLEAGLFSMTARGKNRVQVYDAVMALPKEYALVFLPGLVQGVFPRETTEDAFFKDDERAELNRGGIFLEERSRRAVGERYFFYMALMRASDRLYLSYPRLDHRTRPTLPSFFLDELQALFTRLKPRMIYSEDLLTDPELFSSDEDVREALCAFGGKNHPMLRGLLSLYKKDEVFSGLLSDHRRGSAALIRDERVRERFRQKDTFSATRLELYATCPYRYFSTKILELAEPLEDRKALLMGNLLHEVLEKYFKNTEGAQKSEKRILDILDALWENGPFRYEARYRQRLYRMQLENILLNFVRREAQFHERRGLEPTYFEQAFGFKKSDPDSLEALTVPVESRKANLQGRIDRIDCLPGTNKALLVDYKSSRRAQTIREKLSNGLELQLPIYLMAAKKLLGLDMLGAELRYLKEVDEEGIYRESAKEILDLGRTRTWTDEDWEAMLEKTTERLKALIGRFWNADISVSPKTCNYCPFGAICRFEKWGKR